MTKANRQQIRVRGTPTKAKIGDKFYIHNNRLGKLWCPKEGYNELYPRVGRWIQTVDYDNHFLGLNPLWERNIEPNQWFAFCSCGSPAVIVGFNVYKEGASVSTHGDTKGEMIVCKHHAQFGKHSDGSS